MVDKACLANTNQPLQLFKLWLTPFKISHNLFSLNEKDVVIQNNRCFCKKTLTCSLKFPNKFRELKKKFAKSIGCAYICNRTAS